jgi:hypothetical protein
MNKQTALSLAHADMVSAVALTRQAGKVAEAEIVKFEQMCQAVLTKGESLPESFFAALAENTSKRDIFRAIYTA